MKAIWIIAYNTFQEIIRNRVLYGLMVFSVLIIGFSLVLGQLSFAEQARISVNFGLASIQLASVIIAIFIGSSLVAKEIEKQTILTILVRPITRLQFLLGKSLGLTLVILAVQFGLCLSLYVVFLFLGISINFQQAVALLGVLLESLVLLGFTLFFGSFSTPFMVVAFTGGIWLIGHWQQSLSFFAERSEGASLKSIKTIIELLVPDLERFNWKALPVYDDPIIWSEVGLTSLYAMGWFFILIFCTAWIFKHRNFS